MASAVLNEQAMLDSLEARWASEGYQLIREPKREQLPAFLRGFQPDAIAVGRAPSLVIEVMRSRSPSADTKVRQLQSLFADHPEWRLEVIYASPEGVPMTIATNQEVRVALDEVRRVTDVAPRAALLMAWSILEAICRRLEPNLMARSLSPRSLIDVVISTGRLPQTEFQFLRQMADMRNAVAHGLLDREPSRAEVQRLIQISDTLNGEPRPV
ncbi:DUF4145 domain-containing protein [Caulobacter hibisci]|uniref:DUF4145 domain-containing protein n=1 Tax=Caulobacter hibisci TaxID=2035993 RepID=A0ABS0SWL7_9CAUL|nr:DUF4145 domain-containing protein [Caulobacter hibisci]MBI1683996.1 DUF4145 domain-containing protein [Caulobacter hibisci]